MGSEVQDTAVLVVELAVLFFGVTFLIQILQRRMGHDRVRAWMGGRPVVAALKGIGIGFVTPFCTFTAIPMLIGLRQAGVPPAGYVAFIVAAPVLDPILFGALVIIVGVKAALIYGAIAFVAAVGLALAAQAVDIGRFLRSLPTEDPAPTATGAVCGDTGEGSPWQGIGAEARPAARRAASLLRGMAPLLAIGIAVSLAIEGLVPPDVAERVTGANPTFSIPIAAALGTPLYVSTSLFVPIAESLRSAGVGIGAIVALTIAGAGANLPEFVILSKLARPRVIAVFFGYVFGVAVTGGLIAESLLSG